MSACLQMFYRIVGVLKKFRKFYWKAPVPGKSLTLSMQPAASFFITKETSVHSYFPMSFTEFLRIPFF